MAKRITYGNSPWGACFVQALERGNDSGRLQRGRTYANTGRVAGFSIKGPLVKAKVEGNYSPYYHVRLEFPPFSVEEAAALRSLIGSNGAIQADIRTGLLPETLLAALEAEHLHLLPKRWSSIERSCDCPDYGNPCKHMAAVYYMLARHVDQYPRSLFLLRGFDLDAEFPQLEETAIPPALPVLARSASSTAPEAGTAAEGPALEGASLEGLSGALGDSVLPLLMGLLRARPAFYEHGDFKDTLLGFYHQSQRRLGRLLFDGPLDPFASAGHDKHEAALWLAESRYSLVLPELEGGVGSEAGFAARLAGLKVRLEHPLGGVVELPALELAPSLLNLEEDAGTESYRFFFYIYRFLYQLISVSAFRPVADASADGLRIIWRPFSALEPVRSRLAALAQLAPPLLSLSAKKTADGSSTVAYLLSSLLGAFVASCDVGGEADLVYPRGRRASSKLLGTSYKDPIRAAFFSAHLLDTSSARYQRTPQAVYSWLAILDIEGGRDSCRFLLDEKFGLSAQVRWPSDGPWLHLCEAARLSDSAPALAVAAMLADYLPELAKLRQKTRVRLDEDRLLQFLREASENLKRLGIEVQLPKSLSKALKPRLTLSPSDKGGGNLVSHFNLDQILDYQWAVAVGEQVYSLNEFSALLESSGQLVRLKDGYTILDPAALSSLLEQSRRPVQGKDLLAAYLDGAPGFSAPERRRLDALFNVKDTPVPAGIDATLRSYQLQGFRWMWNNLQNGFGCLLADDMGLGKTLQAICVMQQAKQSGRLEQPALVVVPASLMVNWQRELARFAPELRVAEYYGPKRKVLPDIDVFVSTYETLTRDAAKLAAHGFGLLVLDEAHGLKNAAAKRTKAIRSLPIAARLALSGTPVENRLEDLRSLFDIILPDYLGSAVEFRKLWRVPIELHRDTEHAERLRRITGPFLMRRLKTDPGIAPELPSKTVMDHYARLSVPQAALYQSVLAELTAGMGWSGAEAEASAAKKAGGKTAAGKKAAGQKAGQMAGADTRKHEQARKNAVLLKLLTALKQVCNHPRAYDGQSPAEAELSGKTLLLLDLLRSILDAREKVLVFSQYVGTLNLLKEIIAKELGEECLLLEGSMSQSRRNAVVDRFQNDSGSRIFLISLKAGGVGLNLTAASRVIHYDLWYNPAVEQQASDRAFRIGQTRQVYVHRLIAADTFEQRIDAMLKAKQELAGMSVASGETWLADLEPEELMQVFRP